MRTFPSRKSWGHGGGNRDRVSLLSSSPTTNHMQSFQSQAHDSHAVDSSFEVAPGYAHEKEIPHTAGAIQFVPAYDEAISPAPTQPLSSPEHSFSRDVEASGPRGGRSTGMTSPSGTSPKNASFDQRLRNTETSPSQRKNGSKRIGRLASLFSSRAVVKNMDGQEQTPSPPASESSSAYVGWPGTQDKMGGTVAIDQSSNEGSGAGSRSDANLSGDFHLASALVNASAAANSPLARGQTEAEKVHRLAAPMHNQVRSVNEIYGEDHQITSQKALTDPWGMNNADDMSDNGTFYSKTSSAYFNPKDPRGLRPGQLIDQKYNRKAAASVMRFKPGEPQPITEEALRMKDHFSPPHRTFNAVNAMGYRGLLDRTQDVPNLIDGTDSEITQSTVSGINHSVQRTRTRREPMDPENQIREENSSDIFDGVSRGTTRRVDTSDSDVFDGISNAGVSRHGNTNTHSDDGRPFTLGAAPREDGRKLNLVLLGGGLTTIQTTAQDFSKRVTAEDFDDDLANSDIDDDGVVRIPGFDEMALAGKSFKDRSLGGTVTKMYAPSPRARDAILRYKKHRADQGSDASGSSLFSDPYQKEGWGGNVRGGLQQYYVHPDEMKTVVKKYRKMSNNRSPDLSYEEIERAEDATKAFALSEMRSRIMEKDIERGLERQGGTTVVDDMALTTYNRTAMRVRDALIVAKAWRDGGTPQDVINTAMLTVRPERAHFIIRPANRRQNRQNTTPSYTWEEVTWIDDMEFSQYRCHSIGPRNLRGYEMFTIGDCQSILLKLCNEQCQNLRVELNSATARQIDAEDLMKVEVGDGDGMMTDAEMRYLSSMEEVKVISHKLVLAEKAFTLVRDRIEKLVAKYEALLVKFDNDADSIAPSSVITAASSYISDYAESFIEEREREELARRAQRAELRAELAAREAMLSKQRVREISQEKEQEIQVLQQKLNDLQSEASAAISEREHSVVLARAITSNRPGGSQVHQTRPTAPSNINQSKIDDVKQRFRNRSAARSNSSQKAANSPFLPASKPPLNKHNSPQVQSAAAKERSALFRSVGEEMFQHLDFYERSLKAVETSH